MRTWRRHGGEDPRTGDVQSQVRKQEMCLHRQPQPWGEGERGEEEGRRVIGEKMYGNTYVIREPGYPRLWQG